MSVLSALGKRLLRNPSPLYAVLRRVLPMLPMLFDALPGLRRADDVGWEPRDAPLVHGPKRLLVRWNVEAA